MTATFGTADALALVRERLDRALWRKAMAQREWKNPHRGRAPKAYEAAEAASIELAETATALRMAIDDERRWPGYGWELSQAEQRVRDEVRQIREDGVDAWFLTQQRRAR